VTEEGRQRVVRHGYLPEREIMAGIGPVPVRAPRVRDRVGQSETRICFSSAILPSYARGSKSLEELIPILYLRGISSGDFANALRALLGKDAGGLSASTITRLDGDDALAGLGKARHELLEAGAELVGIKHTEHPTKGVVRWQASTQSQELAKKLFFLLGQVRHIHARLAAAQKRAQRNQQHLVQIMSPGIARARILKTRKAFHPILLKALSRTAVESEKLDLARKFRMRFPCIVVGNVWSISLKYITFVNCYGLGWTLVDRISGGRGGIRTHGTVARTAVFKTAALNHSATLPKR
jgi:Transposase, Mutator family